jgi:SAM-dependent methyltransferase
LSTDEVDVEALFVRLRDELSRTEGEGVDGASARAASRALAERFWPVAAERPLQRRPGLLGALAMPVKKLLRKLMRFYVEPLASDQRAFNDAILKLVDSLAAELDRTTAQRAADARLLIELEDRLIRLERSRGATEPLRPPSIDDFALDTRLRLHPAELIERRRTYVEDFRDAGPVLDLSCGRGELLVLLRDAEIEASGIDTDPDMIAYSGGTCLAVVQAEPLSYLDALEPGTLGGIFAGGLPERLQPAQLLRLLDLARHGLRSGGVLVLEAANPLSAKGLRAHLADLRNVRPLVPETLAFLVREAGFGEIETRLTGGERDYAIVARAR